MPDYTKDTRQPLIELVDYVFESLKNSELLQTIEIDGVIKTVSFFDYVPLGRQLNKEDSYNPPAIFVFIGQQIQDDQIRGSAEEIIKTIIMIDSTVSANSLRTAKKESLILSENIKKVIKTFRVNRSIEIKVTDRVIFQPFVNNDLEEVAIRTFLDATIR